MDAPPELLGQSPGMVAIRQQVDRLLRRQVDARRLPAILIQGETGTGKGLLARAIHGGGPRARGPFVGVNCAAIPETLLEAELFGFERGAFTDARQAKQGLFHAAHRGTILLDEVGLLPVGLQGKLLTVIEERTVRRLGSTQDEPVDIWVLTASSEDLAVLVGERRFREDLYHRLAVVTLRLPPLRERGWDVLLLAEHLLGRASDEYGLPPKSLAPDARAALLAYRWPGNVRELANVMERVALLWDVPVVGAEALGLSGGALGEPPGPAPPDAAGTLGDRVRSLERAHLLEALRESDWNITWAADRLGIPRNTLRYRIRKHGLPAGRAPRSAARRGGRPALPPPVVVPAVREEDPPPSGLRWERRQLTFLRAWLVVPSPGDSPLEASRALEVAVEKVETFGGRVEALTPTSLSAAFGIEPVEDAPRRAAHAAIAILKAAERAERFGAVRVAVAVGLHVGDLAVARFGRTAKIEQDTGREPWALLDRLMAATEPGTVLVTEAAAPFLGRCYDLTLLAVPGGEGRQAYRLTGTERTQQGPPGRVARFVGRQQELDLVRSRMATVLRGHGQVAGIVGEPGIGKSRLLAEFRQGLAGEEVTALEGHCLSYGSTIPYLPLREVVATRFGLGEADSPEAAAEKVRRGVAEAGMDAAAAAAYLCHLLGMQAGAERLAISSPEAIRSKTFETLAQLILDGSRRRPVVLVLEDLHWIDTASEAFLGRLVESLPGAPVLLLLTYRPGYRQPWMNRSYVCQVALQPLSPEESLSVVRSVLPAERLSEPVARLIVERADGNPFFLEELARAVGEQEAPAPALEVPDTIKGALMARIDHLPDEPRRVLQIGAVLGRRVPLALLREIWERPGELASCLEELTRLEFLYEETAGSETGFVFKHALTQEVAYESLSLDERQALHAAAGRALERLHAARLEEGYGALAYHYARTREAPKAVEYLARLARKAARGFAHAEAVQALQEARQHVERLPAAERDRRRVDLVLREAQSLFVLGRFAESLTRLLAEQPRVEALEDSRLAGPYHAWLAHTHGYMGDHERAGESARRAIEHAARCGDEATLGRARGTLVWESFWLGRFLEALEHAREAVSLLERTGERGWLGMTLNCVGLVHFHMGEFAESLEAQARVRSIAEAIGERRLESYAAWGTGIVDATSGDGDAAIGACRHALERAADPVTAAIALGFLGYAHLERSEPTEASRALEEAVRQLGQFRYRSMEGLFTTFLAEARLLDQDAGGARALAERALAISREARYAFATGWALRSLGRAALAREDLLEAEAQLAEAVETFAVIQARFALACCRLDLGRLAGARGNRETATAELAEARRLFETLRLPQYVERAARLAQRHGVSVA